MHNSRPWAIKILYGHYIRVPTNNHGVPPSFESTLWPIIYLYEGKRRYLFRQLLRGERNDKRHKHCTDSFTSGLIVIQTCYFLNNRNVDKREIRQCLWSFLLKGELSELLSSTCGPIWPTSSCQTNDNTRKMILGTYTICSSRFLVCGEIFCFVTGWVVFNAI